MVPSAAKYKAAGANSARRQKRYRRCRAGAAPGKCPLPPARRARSLPREESRSHGPLRPFFPPSLDPPCLSPLPPSVRSSIVLSPPGSPERRGQDGPGARARVAGPRRAERETLAALSLCGDTAAAPRVSPRQVLLPGARAGQPQLRAARRGGEGAAPVPTRHRVVARAAPSPLACKSSGDPG